ncbi:MAG: magnesium transporter [Bacteroidetes bacterium]|nr:magnesium transporter [Bacteroidota bacterium]
MIAKLIKPEIEELINQKNWREIKEIINDVPAVDVGELLEDLDNQTALLVFRLIEKKKASDVFSHLHPDTGVELLNQFTSLQVKEIIGGLPPDDRAAFLEELPGNLVQLIMNNLSPAELNEVKVLLGYPEYSIGRIMTPKYVKIKRDWSIERCMLHLRKWGKSAETINVIYVVDGIERLIDDITVNKLILADPDEIVSSLMDDSFVALNVMDDQEAAVKALTKYDRVALPVVDSDGVLVGIVTADDVFDVAEEETTEDMQLMAGMAALDDYYSNTTIFEMVKKRIGWLVILFVGQLFTTSALSAYQDIISKAVFLSLFIPMIISSGGNTGSQAATLIIRALSTDDLKREDWALVLRREILSGLLLGTLVAFFGFFILLFYAFLNGQEFNLVLWLSSAAISLSLLSVIIFGNILGAMLPFLLTKMGFDPAVTSAPFVSTLSDVTGILIYFTIAIAILKGTIF